MNLPTQPEIYALHQKVCPTDSIQLLEMVWTHCVIVKEIGMIVVEYLEKKHIRWEPNGV